MEMLFYCLIRCGLLAFLFIAAMADLKTLRLNFVFLCVSFTCGFALQTLSGELSPVQIFGGATLGAAAGVISFFSRGAVGAGDAFAVAVCGVWLGFTQGAVLVMCALLFMAVFGIVMVALKKVRLKDSLPFAPFLLAGYIALLAL